MKIPLQARYSNSLASAVLRMIARAREAMFFSDELRITYVTQLQPES
jgi:hypothetical protein